MTQLRRAEEAVSELAIRERSARQETDSARRLAFLAEASALLGASLDCKATLPKVAELAIPFLSDWCMVYLVDNANALQQVALAPADQAASEKAATIRQHTSDWIQRVISRWQAEGAAEIQSSLLRPRDEKAEQPVGASMVVVLPLVARGKVLGAIALVSEQPETITTGVDRALLADFSKRCSCAVDNAFLHREVILQRDSAEKASQVKDEFLGMLSHELRNPLVPIMGWTRIFKTRRDTSEEVFAEGVRSLERNARNIKRLVDDCLELMRTSTRRIRLDLQRTDLNSIAAISVEAVMPLAREKDLKLDIDLSSGPLWVHGDRMRLEQVIVNLLTNAIKYTPSGSIEIRSTKSQEQAELHIADTGIGIAPDLLGRIFEPFSQATKEWLTSHSGLGIGLSIAREIVSQHSGWIWAESPGPRKGSTFSLALPLLAADAYSSLPPIENTTERLCRPRRVLLVEDSDDVLYLIKRELEWTGHKVYPAMDGMTALEIARRELPDIIISDIKMPRLDGYQFIQQVRAVPKLAAVPAIAMTGFGMERDAELARSAGYSAHMVKPVDLHEMEQLIQSLTEASMPS
jgi:signal transduction histidine kinase/ActR/RegA family two-component response regulator